MLPVIPVIPVMTPVKPVMYSCYNHCVNCHECFHRILHRLSDFMIMLYLFIPAIPAFTLVLTLARHLAFAYHSPGEFHLTPLDPHVQVMELGACGSSLLLIRVAQR